MGAAAAQRSARGGRAAGGRPAGAAGRRAACRSRRPTAGCSEPPGASGGSSEPPGAGRRGRQRRRRRRRRGAAAAGSGRRARAGARPATGSAWPSARSRCVGRSTRCSASRGSRSSRCCWRRFFPLLVLILAVLGSIVFGLATPTEAAAVGAFGGFLLAAAYRQLNLGRGQGVGVPHRQDQRDGVLAVRRLGDLLGRVRAARRAGAGRAMGAVDGPDARRSSWC